MSGRRAGTEPSGSDPKLRILCIEDVRAGGLAFQEAYVARGAEYWEVLDLWHRLRGAARP